MLKRRLSVLAAALGLMAALLPMTAGVVSAASFNVGPSATYHTIMAAINAASAGDTIKVAPGVYTEQVLVDKALTVQGAGIGKSIIQGTANVLLDSSGQVRITAGGNVKFSGFTVQKADATASGDRMSIFAAGPSAGGMTYTISGNAIVGSGNPLDQGDYGFYTGNAYDTLVFTNNKISQTGSDPIVLERHYGASNVSSNTFDRGVADGSVDAYFNMNYGGTNITTLQRVSNNKIDMGSGGTFDYANRGFAITFAGAYDGTDGGFTNVQVDHNQIVNLKPNRRGIGFWNNAAAGGDITGVISDNTITGAAGDVTGTIGVRLLGLINKTVIKHNTLTKLETGIQFRDGVGGNGTDATVSGNSLTQVALGMEMQDAAHGNAVLNNKIYASGQYTVTMSAGTSGNAVVLNHLRAATPPTTGNATVQDLGSNTVNSNTN